MKTIALASFIFTGILTLGIPTSISASPEVLSTPGNREVSERKAELLEKFKNSSAMEKRVISVYLASKGATEWLEWAIQGGYITVNAKAEHTLLTAASTYGHLSTVKMLLLQGADIEFKDESIDTPLKAAARAGQLEVVNYLLLKGADPNGEGKNGSTPLSSATYSGRMDIINTLQRYGSVIKANSARSTLIHLAAKLGHVELIEYFAGQGVDIDLSLIHI